jgi:predicted site-specific integrase-resolvase
MFYKTSDVARIFKTTRQTVINWCNSGKIKFTTHPINGYKLFDVNYINQLAESINSGS